MATPIDNNEIEVVCDALWFVKSRVGFEPIQERLWDRLQPIRTGDYGGTAATQLDDDERSAVATALRYCETEVGADDDERALLSRLTPAAKRPA